VLAPLAEAGLTKLEVRALAKAAGYRLGPPGCAVPFVARGIWRTVTREVLDQVERGEESLRQLGFRELRVRIMASWPASRLRVTSCLAPYRWRCWTRLPPR